MQNSKMGEMVSEMVIDKEIQPKSALNKSGKLEDYDSKKADLISRAREAVGDVSEGDQEIEISKTVEVSSPKQKLLSRMSREDAKAAAGPGTIDDDQYVYKKGPDDSVIIVFDPTGRATGKRLTKGGPQQKAYKAIMAKIGGGMPMSSEIGESDDGYEAPGESDNTEEEPGESEDVRELMAKTLDKSASASEKEGVLTKLRKAFTLERNPEIKSAVDAFLKLNDYMNEKYPNYSAENPYPGPFGSSKAEGDVGPEKPVTGPAGSGRPMSSK